VLKTGRFIGLYRNKIQGVGFLSDLFICVFLPKPLGHAFLDYTKNSGNEPVICLQQRLITYYQYRRAKRYEN